jgi:hypothetical protein
MLGRDKKGNFRAVIAVLPAFVCIMTSVSIIAVEKAKKALKTILSSRDGRGLREVLAQERRRYKNRLFVRYLGKFGLTLHPERTRLIDLGEVKEEDKHPKKTFDFLGFTHYMSKSRKGKLILKRKTSSKKLNLALKRLSDWIKFYRHKVPIADFMKELNQKLRGHYAYYGITFNCRSYTYTITGQNICSINGSTIAEANVSGPGINSKADYRMDTETYAKVIVPFTAT